MGLPLFLWALVFLVFLGDLDREAFLFLVGDLEADFRLAAAAFLAGDLDLFLVGDLELDFRLGDLEADLRLAAAAFLAGDLDFEAFRLRTFLAAALATAFFAGDLDRLGDLDRPRVLWAAVETVKTGEVLIFDIV